MRVIAIVLIVLGIVALGCQGYSYVTQQNVADMLPVQLPAGWEKMPWILPVAGVAALVVGMAILALGGRRSSA